MSVYIGAAKMADYTAMQGPCPTGFHVPSKDERVALCGILTSTFSMASNATTMGTYLKMPTAGLRNRSSAGVAGLGSNGYYWSSTAYSSGRTYYLYITSSSLNPQEGGYRATGFSVRCFKDTPVIPDSNWTALYQGTGSAGVFRNSSLGLISVSGDGTTWYTIQDKNLGATTVYNQGDTANDANCGYFYQWGNNYGFAHSGTITNSTTQVDASNYGPGNYYSSSTFIKVSSSPYDWSSVQNDNLWGGVTGVQQTLKELKSAYIGNYIDYLCFTANTAGSTVRIYKVKAPVNVTLEFSTDRNTRSTYTFSDTISLTNAGDKVYFRNTSETDVQFSIDEDNYYHFGITGSVSGSGNITTLLNKNGTLTLSDYCFYNLFNSSALTTPPDIPVTTVGNYSCGAMFRSCSNLTTVPKLPALNIGIQGYGYMFYDCTSLTTINELPATTLTYYCYGQMYRGCTQIKLSSTQTGEYQTPYRIPSSGTGSGGTYQTNFMFLSTGGTFTGTPDINTTYYTSNTVI